MVAHWNRRLPYLVCCGMAVAEIVPPLRLRGSLLRLTSDAGASDWPALSPDGKLVAYSSDRTSEGERDLYVKQVSGGDPIRLTSNGAGNTTPDFSPDGTKIVFRSERDGGGLYEIPAFARRGPFSGARRSKPKGFSGRLTSGLLGGSA